LRGACLLVRNSFYLAPGISSRSTKALFNFAADVPSRPGNSVLVHHLSFHRRPADPWVETATGLSYLPLRTHKRRSPSATTFRLIGPTESGAFVVATKMVAKIAAKHEKFYSASR
jgi:hypothetical protein